jgi:cell division septation protein DedD
MSLHKYFLLACVVITAFLCFGCSSSEEASQKDAATQPQEFKQVNDKEDVVPKTATPDSDKQEIPNVEKNVQAEQQKQAETSKPAPQAQPNATGREQPVQPSSGAMMWSVQIGAFKAEAGALQLVSDAKNKFKQPVYKQYDPVSGFYKVNVGSFQAREQAAQFKAEVQTKGYQDAFLVEVRR